MTFTFRSDFLIDLIVLLWSLGYRQIYLVKAGSQNKIKGSIYILTFNTMTFYKFNFSCSHIDKFVKKIHLNHTFQTEETNNSRIYHCWHLQCLNEQIYQQRIDNFTENQTKTTLGINAKCKCCLTKKENNKSVITRLLTFKNKCFVIWCGNWYFTGEGYCRFTRYRDGQLYTSFWLPKPIIRCTYIF